MSTATLPRRHVSALPRFVAVIAALIVLLGVAAIVHSRSTSSPAPAPAVTTVGDVREPHAHPGRPLAVPKVDADHLHSIQEHPNAAPVTTVPVPVNAGRRATQG